MSGLENLLITSASGAGGFSLGYLTHFLKTRGKLQAQGKAVSVSDGKEGKAAQKEAAKPVYDEIQDIVKAVNFDAYLQNKRAGAPTQYWDTHKRILDGLYEILMENHEDIWSGYRGKALHPIANALNGVIETTARPVRITEDKRPDERKMYFGPANFVYTWDGLSVVKDGRDEKEKPETVTVIATIAEYERTLDEKTGKVVDVKFKGIKRIPGGWIDRVYATTPDNYDPKTYRFGDNFENDIIAQLDARNARKIFGSLDAYNKPIKAGEVAWVNYQVKRLPTPAVIPVFPEKAGGEVSSEGVRGNLGLDSYDLMVGR